MKIIEFDTTGHPTKAAEGTGVELSGAYIEVSEIPYDLFDNWIVSPANSTGTLTRKS